MLWQMLPFALAVLFAVALQTRDPRRIVVSGALLANWLANTIVGLVTGTQFAWPVLAAVDWVTALIIISCSTGRWGAVIVASYALQLVTHVGYAISGAGEWQRYYYWWGLYAEAWLQALIVLVWTLHDRAQVGRDLRDPSSRALAGDAGADPVALRKSGR